MTQDRATPLNDRRRSKSDGGFSLIELIVVMVITALIAVVAVPSLSNVGKTRSRSAARVLTRDLSFARERAIATGTRTWVVFSTSTNSYSVLAEDPASPGRAGAIAITDPANTAKTFVQYLNAGEFAGVTLNSATFDSGSEVGFDWVGKPLNSTSASLAATGTVALSNSCSVTVQAGTGLARYIVP